MNTYIVLLRGINVGSKNKLFMADLRELLSENGYENVKTYIQSGNILLTSTNAADFINTHINNLISDNFGYNIPVVTITIKELKKCYLENPFLKEEDNHKLLHVTFLKEQPDKSTVENLSINTYKNDSYKIIDKIIYIHTPDGYQKTKFSNTVFEKKLNTAATSRNWNTIGKLVALSEQ